MANKRFVTNYSKYVKYKRHQAVKDGVIFEKDYLVLNGDGLVRGDGSYGEGNFVITDNRGENLKLEYKSGDFVKPSDGKGYWTYDDTSEENNVTDSDITVKPNYESLRDFVYYGSCTEAVRVAMSSILEGFPAELYVSGTKADTYFKDQPLYITDDENIGLGGRYSFKVYSEGGVDLKFSDFYYVHNEFGIDLHTMVDTEDMDDAFYLRHFSASHNDYNFIKDEDGVEGERFWNSKYNVVYPKNGERVVYCDNGKPTIVKIIDLMDKTCEGKYLIYVVYLDGEFITLYRGVNYNVHIRPQNYYIKKFFDGLDGMKRLLLNPDTNPRFTINITTPYWTDNGIVNKKTKLRFPTFNNWNLDVTTDTFGAFYRKLLEVSEFMDENYTDNLWKHMVHDSIKNKDNTYVNEEADEDKSDYVIGVGKMEKLMHVIGAFFDLIKVKIDNIKSVNTVTYNGSNNTPDYFMSDANELSGWDVKDPVSVFKYEHKVENIFSEEKKTYNTADAKNRFMKYLKINSPHIFSRKGTKEGVEMLMSLFGLVSYDYARLCGSDEYDYKIDEFVCVTDGFGGYVEDVVKYNSMKYTFDTTGDDMQGLMVASVYVGENRYLIPWFDKSVKYDGDVYYQMSGGWSLNKKEGESLSDKDGLNPFGYDESVNYMIKVGTIDDLMSMPKTSLYDGMVVKVIDFSTVNKDNIERLFTEYGDLDEYDYSQYFYLSDITNTGTFGEDGWLNIPQRDIDINDKYGKLVNHLERMVTTNFGNAPHVGYGLYDDGRGYLSHFSNLFKHAIDTMGFSEGMYDCDGELIPEVGNIGFKGIFGKDGEVLYVKDNKRVWYFDDEMPTEGVVDGAYESDIRPYDFETGEMGCFNESSANSVINTKKIKITFRVLNDENRLFIEECVLPYAKQLIPSGLLLEIVYDNGMVVGVSEFEEPVVMGVTNDSKSSFKEYLHACDDPECEDVD